MHLKGYGMKWRWLSSFKTIIPICAMTKSMKHTEQIIPDPTAVLTEYIPNTKITRYLPLLKVNQSHNTPMEVQGQKRCNFYSFTTSAVYGGELSASSPGRALAAYKRPSVPIVQEVGWAPLSVWTQRLEKKSSCLCRQSNFNRLIVLSVARHYTD
jgi:hypothetical protein